MTVMANLNDESSELERRRRLRGRNYAVLAALIALVVLFYIITVVRMGGAH